MKKFFKIIGYTFLIVFTAFLFTRIWFTSYYPDNVLKIAQNPIYESAYAERGGNMSIYTQKPGSNYGFNRFFYKSAFIIIPDAKQLQVTVKYNVSAFEKMKTELELEFLPTHDDLVFILRDDTGKCYPLSSIENYTELLMYHYFKLVFDEAPLDGLTAVYLDVYIGEDADFESEPADSILLYSSSLPLSDYKLSKKEIPSSR